MNETVSKIVYLIKKEDDYDQAATLMIQNNLTITKLSEQTLKLSQIELARLADKILQKK
ncbi:hypothetical protein [Halarcobacter bivalviorum]|uniref:hypothetical protein n=1 Tax=Halarcobacter bivalviorum TaxID=663364 RepID=UPI0013E95A6A|nr:hypothetical protein [Halarcobacter bivalviorum]